MLQKGRLIFWSWIELIMHVTGNIELSYVEAVCGITQFSLIKMGLNIKSDWFYMFQVRILHVIKE